MEKSLKYSLNISILAHLLILAGIPARQKKVVSIPLHVELMRIRPVVQQEPVKPRDEGIKQPKKEVKKEEKKPEPVKPKEEPEQAVKQPEEPKPQLIQASSNIMLEAKDFPFAYYLKILQNKIASNWEWPVKSGMLKTVVYFKIQRDGQLKDINVDKTSGDYLFDQAAKRAVNLVNPMIPLPDGYDGGELGVYFEFKYNE